MLSARTLKTLAILVAGYVLLALPAYWGPAVLEEMSGYLACGWGWCSPTAWGWAFLACFWLGVAWFVAWALARLTARRRAD